jgi:hypothetical protein
MSYELIQKLLECAIACEDCVKADRKQEQHLTDLARLNRDCSDICLQAICFLKRNSELTFQYLKLCERVCLQCAETCQKNNAENCQLCAVACANCAVACQRYYLSVA